MRSVSKLAALGVCLVCAGYSQGLSGTGNGEWPAYAGDLNNYHYSPLDQVNGSNFGKLELAWRFKTDALGTRPEYKLEGTPIMVKGVLYATAGTRRAVIALDAATGELLWVHGEHEGSGALMRPGSFQSEGFPTGQTAKEMTGSST